MGNFKHGLGVEVIDIVTEFRGITTARIDYLGGANEYLVSPPHGRDAEPSWIKEGRLEATGKATYVEVAALPPTDIIRADQPDAAAVVEQVAAETAAAADPSQPAPKTKDQAAA